MFERCFQNSLAFLRNLIYLLEPDSGSKALRVNNTLITVNVVGCNECAILSFQELLMLTGIPGRPWHPTCSLVLRLC